MARKTRKTSTSAPHNNRTFLLSNQQTQRNLRQNKRITDMLSLLEDPLPYVVTVGSSLAAQEIVFLATVILCFSAALFIAHKQQHRLYMDDSSPHKTQGQVSSVFFPSLCCLKPFADVSPCFLCPQTHDRLDIWRPWPPKEGQPAADQYAARYEPSHVCISTHLVRQN